MPLSICTLSGRFAIKIGVVGGWRRGARGAGGAARQINSGAGRAPAGPAPPIVSNYARPLFRRPIADHLFVCSKRPTSFTVITQPRTSSNEPGLI